MHKCLLVLGVKLGLFVGLILDVNAKQEAVVNRTEGRVWTRRLKFQLIIGFKWEKKLCELELTATVSSQETCRTLHSKHRLYMYTIYELTKIFQVD